MQQVIPLTRPDKMQAAGLPWETTDQARWAFRRRHENGLAGVFIRIDRRIYVVPDKFHERVRGNAA